ncbi:hypothetical protein [Pseudomonas matsuisoli]|uniref:Uncharacterized protein n=1 Tax=Pseudomonas matsuisoli TaxID=1515666 RepID=A0A917V0V6_9PSED|nr:hypothetical protein [Pseudomonas matsuisoli]GGK06391.1 hypothetical protein GCM10009304_35660 [Pseudomonas matsuisoli]
MQKWTDQPATDSEDVLDFILAFASTFLRRHASLIAKVLPPAFGFGIFLAYFARHHFYPSFDLFQFSSLLLAASCLGFAVVGAFVAVLFMPGAWIFYGFLNTKTIKEDITYALPYRGDSRVRKVFLLMGLTFFLPYLLAGTALVASIFVAPSMLKWIGFLTPVMILLVAGLIIQCLFELGRFSFWKYLWNAYIPTVITGYFIVWMWIKAYPVVEHWYWPAKWGVVLAAPPAIAFIAALCGMLFVAGWRAVMLFATFFALLMAGYSGALTTLPDTVVNALGLGNYQAKAIVLDTAYCDTSCGALLPSSPNCVLEDVHVVWSFGDALTLRLEDGGTAWLPANAVRALIRP